MGYVEELRKLVGHRPLILVGAVVIIEDQQGKILLQKGMSLKDAGDYLVA